MNKRTHIQLGRIVFRFVESKLGIPLKKSSFLFGNILPDVYLSFLTRPHTIGHTLDLVDSKIEKLMAQTYDNAYIGRRFSRRLGVICHYYADYFCYPHSPAYTGDIKDHVVYEKTLWRYIKEAYAAADAEELCGGRITLDAAEDAGTCLIRLQAEYGAAKPSFDLDLRCGILACIQAVFTITMEAFAERPETQEVFEPMMQTA